MPLLAQPDILLGSKLRGRVGTEDGVPNKAGPLQSSHLQADCYFRKDLDNNQ